MATTVKRFKVTNSILFFKIKKNTTMVYLPSVTGVCVCFYRHGSGLLKKRVGTSLGAQWLRILLPMQGTWV